MPLLPPGRRTGSFSPLPGTANTVRAHLAVRTSTSWTLPASAGPSSRTTRDGRTSLPGPPTGGTSYFNAKRVADPRFGPCLQMVRSSIVSPKAEIRCPTGVGNSRAGVLENELRGEHCENSAPQAFCFAYRRRYPNLRGPPATRRRCRPRHQRLLKLPRLLQPPRSRSHPTASIRVAVQCWHG